MYMQITLLRTDVYVLGNVYLVILLIPYQGTMLLTMSVDSVLTFLLIVSFDTMAATSREIIFRADMILNNHQISTERFNTTDIAFGSKITLICHCNSCSTIEFLKNGVIKFGRYFSGELCQINNVKKVNGCKPHSARYMFEVKTRNDNKWFCRGKTLKESWLVSRGQQLTITSKQTSTDDKETSTGNKETSTGNKETSTGNKETSTGNKETSTGNKETSTGVIETTTSTGLGTSGPEVQTPTEVNQNNLTIISAVTTVLVVVLVLVTVILCLKKRKNKRVTKLNRTSPEDKRAVKETPGSRESLCVMEENEIYESNDGGFVNQDSTPENRKSICIMEANPLYEIT